MIWSIVCAILASLLAFVFTLRILMGEDDETLELKERLKFHGIDPRQFSNRCLTELIETRTRHLRLVHRPIGGELRSAIDQVAIEVRNLTFGNGGFLAADLVGQSHRGKDAALWRVLAEHDPGRYDLQHLEATQTCRGKVTDGRS